MPPPVRHTRLRLAALAGALALVTVLALTVAGLLLGATWPQDTAFRSAAQGWITLGTIVLVVVTPLVAVVLALARARVLDALSWALVAFLTAVMLLFLWAGGATLWPLDLRLGQSWRLRTVEATVWVGCAALVYALLRSPDPDDLPPWRTVARRLLGWGLVTAALFLLAWVIGWRWG